MSQNHEYQLNSPEARLSVLETNHREMSRRIGIMEKTLNDPQGGVVVRLAKIDEYLSGIKRLQWITIGGIVGLFLSRLLPMLK